MSNTDTIIRLQNITKRYGYGNAESFALRNFNLTVKRGEFIMIMGPSGCGKTTLLNIIGLLDKATSGSYMLNNKNAARLSRRKQAHLRSRKIGFIFQNFNLISTLPVIENVSLPMVYAGYSKARRLRIASEVLDRFHLGEREYYMPWQLSGGQQQRVAIARSLVTNPEIILADEPTGNLDTRSSHIVMEELRNIHASGNTIIMVTHNPALTTYATRVIHMLDGHIDTDIKTVADSDLPQPAEVHHDKNSSPDIILPDNSQKRQKTALENEPHDISEDYVPGEIISPLTSSTVSDITTAPTEDGVADVSEVSFGELFVSNSGKDYSLSVTETSSSSLIPNTPTNIFLTPSKKKTTTMKSKKSVVKRQLTKSDLQQLGATAKSTLKSGLTQLKTTARSGARVVKTHTANSLQALKSGAKSSFQVSKAKAQAKKSQSRQSKSKLSDNQLPVVIKSTPQNQSSSKPKPKKSHGKTGQTRRSSAKHNQKSNKNNTATAMFPTSPKRQPKQQKSNSKSKGTK